MRILNAYCGIGGNRKGFEEGHRIIAIDTDQRVLDLYQDKFKNDICLNVDAHDYILKNYQEFDFIWASPPCVTHSRARNGREAVYQDMSLWQEILFLQKYYTGYWVVENVIPSYRMFIPGKRFGRHMIWSNFYIESIKVTPSYNEKLSGSFWKHKAKRNEVPDLLAKHIFESLPIVNKTKQGRLF